MDLTTVERDSPLALRLAKHFEERLAELRQRNDADLDDAMTAALRGQIKECKATLLMLRGKPEFDVRIPAKKAGR